MKILDDSVNGLFMIK